MGTIIASLILSVGITLSFSFAAAAHDENAHTSEELQWFRNQLSPKSGGNCCNESDGEFTEEDIRCDAKTNECHYWARFSLSNGHYMQIPDDVVIKKPNKWGRPAVWWYIDEENYLRIRCYVPGAGG